MRYFGQTDKLLPQLQDDAFALFTVLSCHENDPLGPLPIYPSSAARKAWQSYIFRESCRRTLIIAFQAIATCNLLKGNIGSCAHELIVGNLLIISSALWDAKSPFEFVMAWYVTPGYKVGSETMLTKPCLKEREKAHRREGPGLHPSDRKSRRQRCRHFRTHDNDWYAGN
jgi:hypothetical protein